MIFYDQFVQFKQMAHRNWMIKIGIYGFLVMLLLSAFQYELLGLQFQFDPFLPPAWIKNGQAEHFLGTDGNGRDLLYLVFCAYQISFSATLITVFSVILLTFLFYFLMNRSHLFQWIMTPILHLFMIVPPLLTVLVVALFSGNNRYLMLLVIGLAYLPHFLSGLQRDMQEMNQKDYLMSDRLEGFSSIQLFVKTIWPNLYPKFIAHVITLASEILLTITMITFFEWVDLTQNSDLGRLMKQLLPIYHFNPWPFLSCGLLIMLTIMFVHLISLGLDKVTQK